LNKEAPVGKRLPVVWKPPVAGPEQVCLSQEALRAEGVGLGEGAYPPGTASNRNRFKEAIHINPGSCRHNVRWGCAGGRKWVI